MGCQVQGPACIIYVLRLGGCRHSIAEAPAVQRVGLLQLLAVGTKYQQQEKQQHMWECRANCSSTFTQACSRDFTIAQQVS